MKKLIYPTRSHHSPLDGFGDYQKKITLLERTESIQTRIFKSRIVRKVLDIQENFLSIDFENMSSNINSCEKQKPFNSKQTDFYPKSI